MKLWGALAGIVLGLLLVAVIAWSAGEAHYRNCLQRVELEYPEAFQPAASSPTERPYGETEEEGSFEFFRQVDREEAISSCSRWP